ncbi:MAG: hypothetical protein LBG80_20420 [Bacteroidales bacterium]|jgi:hypothetical protein|nr:hypothetical protein [Bacteroidales bacterium]
MAKRFIIKDKVTNKFYHLSVSKGSYKIRDYSDPKEKPTEIDSGKEKEMNSRVWSKYDEQFVAPYQSINDTAFWHSILSQDKIEDVKKKSFNETTKQTNKIVGKIKLPFVLTVILASMSKIIDVNFLNIEVHSLSFNFQSIEILTKIIDILLIAVLIVFTVQLLKLIRLGIELLTIYIDLHSKK